MMGEPSWLEIWDEQGIGDLSNGVTVFVPVDAAFERLDPAIRTKLEVGELTNDARYLLLGNHYVHRPLPSEKFEPGPAQVWRGTADLSLDPLTFGGQLVVQTDLRVSNGYIHLLDGVVISDVVRGAIGSS